MYDASSAPTRNEMIVPSYAPDRRSLYTAEMKHFIVDSGDFVTTTGIYRMLGDPEHEVTLVYGDAVPTVQGKSSGSSELQEIPDEAEVSVVTLSCAVSAFSQLSFPIQLCAAHE